MDGIEDYVAKEALREHLPAVLLMLKYGARLSTKKMIKQGIDPLILSQIDAAKAEWESKCVPLTTPVSPDKNGNTDTHPHTFSSPSAAGGMGVGVSTQPPPTLIPIEREEWMKDGGAVDGNACPLCSSSFTLIFRRHHCRLCGSLACAHCSSKKLTITHTHTHTQPEAHTHTHTTATERACDVCFNLAYQKAVVEKQHPPTHPPTHTHTHTLTNQATKEDEKKKKDNQAATATATATAERNAQELGLYDKKSTSSSTTPTPHGTLPANTLSLTYTQSLRQTQNVMSENMQLMAERGEKLHRMAERTERMQQGAVDFAAAAKALADREKNKKWWEL